MNVTCSQCGRGYDDAERTTICPHERFLSPAMQARKDAALALFGQEVRWASDRDGAGDVLRVQSVSWDGMVTVNGYSGEFAPHLFRLAVTA